MSDRKPYIHDSEIDDILEQVQKKRAASAGAPRPGAGSEQELDEILAGLGIDTGRPRRAPVEPILVPLPDLGPAVLETPQAGEKALEDDAPEDGAQEKGACVPAPKEDAGAAADTQEQDEVPTLELPDIKAYSEAEAQKQAAERARIMEEARREVQDTLHSAAGQAVREAARAAAAQQDAEVPPGSPAVTGNDLFGEVDDRFRKFFSTSVIDDPTQEEDGGPRRRREKGGFWAKVFAKKESGACEEDAPEEDGEYYEATEEEGVAGEEARGPVRRAAAGGAAVRARFDDTLEVELPRAPGAGAPVPMQAADIARAVAKADTFDLDAARGRRTVDIDIPLDGDGTGEYAPVRRRSAALSAEEDVGEYNRLSDAPAVAQGLASMRRTRLARTVLTGVLALLLIYMGLSAREGWLPPVAALDPHTAPLTYLVTSFVLLAVAALSSITMMGAGLRGLAVSPTTDSFTATAVIAALLQNVAWLFDAKAFDPEAATLFAPVAALLLCGNALGKWLQACTICANFALASSGEEHAAAFPLEKQELSKRLASGLGEPQPRLLLNRPTALVKGFLRQSFSARAADAVAQKQCWALAGVGVLCAVVCGVKGGGVLPAVSGMAAAICLGAPLAATLVYALPAGLLQRTAARFGAVVPGPSAVDALGRTNTVLLRGRDLFPAGTVRLHGIKTFEKERIDVAILYAASILAPGCETLRGVFMGMLDNNEKLLAAVESPATEVGYGFSGWIEHRRILLGSREMMKRHDIEVPSLDYEKKYTKNGQRSPIYLAVAGKLFGMFLVSYRQDAGGAEILDRLVQSGISVLVQADDFNVTAPLVSATYGVPRNMVKVLSQAEQDALETELAYQPESEGVMMHTGTCASFLGGMRAAACAAAGERLACVVQLAMVGLSAVVAVALAFYAGLTGLSLGAVLLYQAAWCALTAAVPFLKKP